MGNTVGKKRKLGSASSAKWFAPEGQSKKDGLSPLGRSYSMPVYNAKPKNDNYHVVALTSSTYGILKVDLPKDKEDSNTAIARVRVRGDSAPDSKSFNFQDKPRKFDLPEVIVQRPRSEVDEMMKVQVKSTSEGKAQRAQFLEAVKEEPETINMWELMEGLEDDARSPLPENPPSSLLAPKPGTVGKKVRNLETSLSFSSVHSVTEPDVNFLEGDVESELRTALHTVTLIQGKCYTQNSSTNGAGAGNTAGNLARHGSGEESTPSSHVLQRDLSLATCTPGKLESSANLPFSGFVDFMSRNESSSCNKSQGVFGSLPNKVGGVAVDSPKTPVKGIVETFGKVCSGPQINHLTGLSPSTLLASSPRGLVTKGLLSPRFALQQAKFEKACTSPDFPTSSSSGESGDQEPPREGPFFDPELLASFERAIEDVSEDEWYRVRRSDAGVASTSGSSSDGDSPPLGRGTLGVNSISNYSNKTTVPQASPLARSTKPDADVYSKKMSSKVAPVDFRDVVLQKVLKKVDPFEIFEEKCPPGGQGRVVIYVTSLRGIRKTFEDCSHMKLVVKGYRVAVDERDVSMHSDFRQELKDLLGRPMPVPRLFIKGRYIGGAQEVSLLHEDGTLAKLLESIPTQTSWEPCDGCGDHRFVPCSECSGSCKVITEDDQVARCTECNENGLVRCPICF